MKTSITNTDSRYADLYYDYERQKNHNRVYFKKKSAVVSWDKTKVKLRHGRPIMI